MVRKDLGRANFRSKVPGTLKIQRPKVFTWSPQIKGSILPSFNPHIPPYQSIESDNTCGSKTNQWTEKGSKSNIIPRVMTKHNKVLMPQNN